MREFEHLVAKIRKAVKNDGFKSSRIDVGQLKTTANAGRAGHFMAHLILDRQEYVLTLVPTDLER